MPRGVIKLIKHALKRQKELSPAVSRFYSKSFEDSGALDLLGREGEMTICVELKDLFIADRCAFCNSEPEKGKHLKKCGGCHTIPYCDTQCQREDRATHRHVCAAIQFPLEFALVSMALPLDVRVPQMHIPNEKGSCPVLRFYMDAKDPSQLMASWKGVESLVFDKMEGETLSTKKRYRAKKWSLLFKTGQVFTADVVDPDKEPLVGDMLRMPNACNAKIMEELAKVYGVNQRLRVMKALEGALAVQAKMWITSWTVPAGRAVPAWPIHPEMPPGAKYNKYSAKGVSSYSIKSDHLKPLKSVGSELARAVLPAPVHPDEISEQVPLHPRMKPFAKKPFREPDHYTSFLRYEEISITQHPGPFFALPGDEVTTLLLCQASPVPEGQEHPLGLAPGACIASVEFNTGTGAVRMLTSQGWRFAVLTAEQLDATGFLEAKGSVFIDPDIEAPKEWSWQDGRPLWKIREERYGQQQNTKKPFQYTKIPTSELDNKGEDSWKGTLWATGLGDDIEELRAVFAER